MKKLLYVVSLSFICINLYAQTPTEKPPKLRYTTGFFNVKWELGDKDVNQKEVQLHLDKNDTDASYNFKRARALEKQSAIFLLLGTAALVTGLYVKEEAAIAGYGSAVVFSAIGLGTSISSKQKYDKATNLYNRKFGY